MDKFETLEELVAARKGYKYVNKDGESPYQHHRYDLKSRKQMVTKLDASLTEDCGEGWNLATTKWIADNCMRLDGIIMECEIPKRATIIVPHKTNGKFRTDIIKIKKIHTVESFFPILKDVKTRLSDYKPINPIIAEEMPDKSKIKKIMNPVRDQVWNQVGDQVWAPVRDQVGAQVGAQVWDQVWAPVRAQVRDPVWDQVWDQVRDQVWVCAYKAVADFFNLDYDHPGFELIRLGIMVIRVLGKFKVFGKGGKYLGEIDE